MPRLEGMKYIAICCDEVLNPVIWLVVAVVVWTIYSRKLLKYGS